MIGRALAGVLDYRSKRATTCNTPTHQYTSDKQRSGARLASRKACSRSRARDERVARGRRVNRLGRTWLKGVSGGRRSYSNSHYHTHTKSAGEDVTNTRVQVSRSRVYHPNRTTGRERIGPGERGWLVCGCRGACDAVCVIDEVSRYRHGTLLTPRDDVHHPATFRAILLATLSPADSVRVW